MNKNPSRSSPIIGIFVMTLLIATSALPLMSGFDQNKYVAESISLCSFAWPPSLWNEVLYSGNGHWQERSVDGSIKDPYGALHCYAIADSNDNPSKVFDVGLFTPSMDWTGEILVYVECGIAIKLDTCGEAFINVYSGGVFETTIGHWDSNIDSFPFSVGIDPTGFIDPSDVTVEFYYTTNGQTDCGFFSFDNVDIFSAGTHYLDEDFGFCYCEDPIELTVGVCDDFDLSNGPETTDPRQEVTDWIDDNYVQGNPYLTPESKDCDEIDAGNQYWAHSFDLTDICPGGQIEYAVLDIRLKNAHYNDHIKIGCIESTSDSWEHNVVLGAYLDLHATGTITIDLDDIPNLLDEMNTLGYLDVAVDDDSPVDCAKLTICCEDANLVIKINKYAEDHFDTINAQVGDIIHFTIEVFNTGDPWESLTVHDDIPPCLQYQVNSANPDDLTPGVDFLYGFAPGTDVGWHIDDFQSYQHFEFTYTCEVVSQPSGYDSENYGEATAKIGSLEESVDDKVILYFTSKSIIDTSGELSWSELKPGETVTSYIYISNVGEKDSDLNWEIQSYPEWGTWTFTPSSGANLKPEKGPVQVEVEVEAPDEKDKEFTGDVKIINLNNPEDYEIVPVSLSTPINPDDSFFIYLIKKIIQIFPVLESLLGPILDGLQQL